ncbi:MAG: hypothetical protein ACYC26_01380 [Phycisphaerales bacterium]
MFIGKMMGVGAVVLCTGTAWATTEYRQFTLPSPGYYVNAYGGLGNGTSPNPGDAFSTDYQAGNYNFDYHNGSSANGTAFSSTSYANAGQNVTGSAHGTTGFGVIKLYADFAAPNNASFPAFRATGGWKDTLTFHNPALTGTAGSFTANLHIDGTLQALAGFNSSAGFSIGAYKNETFLPGTWNYTYSGQGQIGFPYNQSVNTTITFTVPFTYGQSFTLGFYGLAWARTASVAGASAVNTGFSDFDHTVTWSGITGLTDYSVASGSGIDWSNAVIPEPASASILLLATAASLLPRRKA